MDFLNDWPEDRRDVIHEAALRACCDAYDRRKPVSVARNAFFGFAKRAAILEDATSAMQLARCLQSGTGKVQA
ncbi:DUF982 domain-containing protein [Mesorhizobium sp. M1050]|uniref:DUF982 domain-containing protein n=1 Tax=Mesorhizobium sp. M1050 TaxID=2957051 RepID=UPI003337C56D